MDKPSPNRRTALIIGISGQDGTYLAHQLLDKGYRVVGTSRDAHFNAFTNLKTFKILDLIQVRSLAPNDFRSVMQALTSVEPDEIYYLAGQSSVGLSFDQPVEAMQSVAEGVMTLLEAIRFLQLPARLFHAASSEAFGNTPEPATEETPFRPRSPYAVAKSTAFWLVSSYRQAYGIHASNGILFNHESPLRPDRFVTSKIVAAAARIAAGSREKLHLGNLDIERDWGWAPEYTDAMWRIVQHPEPSDFIIATGETHSLREFVGRAFELGGLNWQDHVESDDSLLRPFDVPVTKGNPNKVSKLLQWQAETKFDGVIQKLFDAARAGSSPSA